MADVAEFLLPTPGTEDHTYDAPGRRGGASLSTSLVTELLNSPIVSGGTGVGEGRRKESTLRGQVDNLLPTPTTKHAARSRSDELLLSGVAEALLPTPRTGSNRNSRKGLVPEGHNHWGAPALEQVTDFLSGELPREYADASEVQGAAGALLGLLLPTPKADDGRAGSPGNKGSSGDLTLPSAALALMPTPDAQMGGAGGRSGDPDRARDAGHHVTINEVAQALKDWGPYEPAIRRWERVTGREAPWATEPSPRSKKGRLAPRFVEWMMGWPLGWVTAIMALSRNAQLKILGNGVVPQQAEAAVRFLLAPPRHREPKRRPRKALRRATPRGLMKAAREAGTDG